MDSTFFDRFTDATWDLDVWRAMTNGQRAVLEIGCGTGRVGRCIRGAGTATSGIERDPDLAAVASRHLDHVWVGDLLALPAGRRFPMAIVPCNTAAVLPHGWLTAARRWLEAGGRLAFDVILPEHRSWGHPPYTWEHQRGDLHEGGTYDPTSRTHTGWMRWRDQTATRTTVYPPLTTYIERLQRAGFAPPVILDARGRPVAPEHPTVDWCLVHTRAVD